MKYLLIILLYTSMLFAESNSNVLEIQNISVNNPNQIRESSILYKLKDNATPSQLKRFNSLINPSTILEKRELKGIKVNLVKIKNIKGEEKNFSKKLQDTGAVEFAELDVLVPHANTIPPTDPSYYRQWHHPFIGSPSAWLNTVGSDSVKVCVLDTGVDTDHPDLAANLLLPGYNAFYREAGGVEDLWGHGTFTAGLVGALANNGSGGVGMNWNISIIPVQVNWDWISSSAYISDMADGIVWCANYDDGGEKVKVANLSYGGAESATIDAAAQYFRGTEANPGGLLFMSAGNSGTYHTSDDFPDYTSFVAVGATSESDILSEFSEFGPYIDIVAPGVDIYSTYYNGGYAIGDGTSFSSPIAAGLAALIYSINLDFTPSEVESFIFDTANKNLSLPSTTIPYTYEDYYGNGRIEVAAAISAALNNGGNILPVAIANSDITSGDAPLTVLFDASGSHDNGTVGGSVVSYSWEFGNGDTSDKISPSYIFLDAGTYNVTLRVTDNEGGESLADTVVINVLESQNINNPLGLVGDINEDTNNVTLSWSHENLTNDTEYEIYRAKKRRGKYNYPSTPTGTSSTKSYLDELVDKGDYRYKVLAKEGSNISGFSNVEPVIVETGLPSNSEPTDPTEPTTPTLSLKSISGKTIELTLSPECNTCTYTLERGLKTKGSVTFEVIIPTSIVGTIIEDTVPENGTYVYRIYINGYPNSISNRVTVRIK